MPELGLHKSMPFADYAAIRAVNSGVIKAAIDSSLFHARETFEGRIESGDTSDRKLGRAIHCRLLEPERYAADFLVATVCNSQFKDGSPCKAPGKFFDGKAWYCGRHKHDDCTEPTDFISIEQAANIEAMATALHEHPALAIARRTGWSEVSVVGELHGVLCKGRMDRVPEEMDIIIDVKKCGVGKGADKQIKDSIANYGWHRQASIYVDLLRQFHPVGKEPMFAWVFIEDAHPFKPNVMFADAETLDCGRWEVEQVLTEWNRAEQYGKWPDYMPDPRRPAIDGLPAWYREQWHKRKKQMEQVA